MIRGHIVGDESSAFQNAASSCDESNGAAKQRGRLVISFELSLSDLNLELEQEVSAA